MDHREASVAVIQFIEMLWELAHPSHDLSEATTAVLANPMDAEGTIPAVVIIGAVLQVRCRVCVCVCVCAMCVCTNGVCAQCVRAVASSTPTQMYSPCQLILSICFFFLPTSSSLPLLFPSLLLPPSFIFLLPSSFIPHSFFLLPSFFLFRRSEGQYRCHGASVRRRLAMSPYLPPSQTSTGRLLVIG